MENNRSYIEEIGVSDISRLIEDYKLENSGYEFYYIIDSFDIISFCFPYLKYKDEILSEKNEFVLDGLLAYRYLLYDYKNKCILPDEYFSEISSFRNRMETEIEELAEVFKKINNSITSKFKNFDAGVEEGDVLLELQENIKLISAFLSGRYSSDSIRAFDELIADQLITNKFSSGNIDDDYIQRVFERNMPSDLYKTIFKYFYEQFKKPIEKKNEYEVSKFLLSIIRDAKVIDRVININKQLVIDNKKYIFLYVSSTPLRSPFIFDFLDDNGLLPNIGEVNNYMLLRDQHEIYLRFLLDNYSNSRSDKILLLNSLLESAKLSEAVTRNSSLPKNYKLDIFSEMAEITRTDLESKLLIRRLERAKEDNNNYEDFKVNLLGDLLDETKGADLKSLSNFIEQVYRLFQAQNFEQLSSSSANLHRATYALNYEINEMISNSDISTINSGKDIIAGAFHHFPSLLFYNYKGNKELFSLVVDICDSYASEALPKNSNFQSNWIKFANAFSKKDLLIKYSSDEVTLVKLFILSIVPGDTMKILHPDNIHEDKDKLVYESLKDIQTIVEARIELGSKIESAHEFGHELYYFICWISRRELDFDSAINSANDGIKMFPKSSRLHQGAGLAWASKFYVLFRGIMKHERSLSKLIREAIRYLEQSEILFLDELNNLVEKPRRIVGKNLCSISNTLADLYCKKYMYSGLEPDLLKSRSYIEVLKNRCKELNIEYLKMPNFNHTEADVEISEAQQMLKKNSNHTLIINKISEAEHRISVTKTLEVEPKVNKLIRYSEDRIAKLRISLEK